MEFELTWIDSSRVVCRTSGTASAKDYAALLRALTSSPEFGPDVKVLMDFRALDVSSVTAADMEKIAILRARFASEVNFRSAMVVGPGGLKYGLGRMFQSYATAQMELEVSVFHTFDEGMAWLQADDVEPAP
jgi:hypothetical protein